METLLKMSQVMERLSISKSMVIRLRDEGKLPCVYIGTAVRFKESVVNQFINDMETQ